MKSEKERRGREKERGQRERGTERGLTRRAGVVGLGLRRSREEVACEGDKHLAPVDSSEKVTNEGKGESVQEVSCRTGTKTLKLKTETHSWGSSC